VTYNGSPNPPANVDRYTVVGIINDPDYEGSATATLTITRRLTAGNVAYTRAPGLNLRIEIANLLTHVASLPADGATFALVGVGVSSQSATITTNSTYVLYTPANDNNDSFTYTVGDDSGGSATGTITVNVVKSVGPSLPANGISVSGGTAAIHAFGIPGYTYVMQTTTNLNGPWWPIGTNTAGNDGSLLFIDPNATNWQQYYRMAQP